MVSASKDDPSDQTANLYFKSTRPTSATDAQETMAISLRSSSQQNKQYKVHAREQVVLQIMLSMSHRTLVRCFNTTGRYIPRVLCPNATSQLYATRVAMDAMRFTQQHLEGRATAQHHLAMHLSKKATATNDDERRTTPPHR